MELLQLKLSDNKFYDCKINYNCIDANGSINVHMIILDTSPLFHSLFKHTTGKPILDNKRYINAYTIKFPFTKQSLLICIDLLYEKNIDLINCEHNTNYENYCDIDSVDIFNAISHFELEEQYVALIGKLLYKKIKILEDYNEIRYIMCSVCESNMDTKNKKTFLIKTIYLLDDEDKDELNNVYPQFAPTNICNNNEVKTGSGINRSVYSKLNCRWN